MTFPCWIEDDNGVCWWMTDNIAAHGIDSGMLNSWRGAHEHSSISKHYGVVGVRRDGEMDVVPAEYAADIANGRCDRIMRANAEEAVRFVLDKIPHGVIDWDTIGDADPVVIENSAIRSLPDMPKCKLLHVYNCPNLESIGDLPECAELIVADCQKLSSVRSAPVLQYLEARDCMRFVNWPDADRVIVRREF